MILIVLRNALKELAMVKQCIQITNLVIIQVINTVINTVINNGHKHGHKLGPGGTQHLLGPGGTQHKHHHSHGRRVPDDSHSHKYKKFIPDKLDNYR